MQNKYTYFLTVAQDLNISKSSKKLFVSQQCLSAHIKKLEKEYNTVLFNRKPRLSLTPAGKVLLRMLTQMQLLEANARQEISCVNDETTGELKIGMHSSRTEQFGQPILSRFWNHFPNVKIYFTDGTTDLFENMLANDDIDMYLGVNPAFTPKNQYLNLFTEKIYLATTHNLIKEYFPSTYPHCLGEFCSGIDISSWKNVPFLISHAYQSTLTKALFQFFDEKNMHINIKLFSNNAFLRNSLAAMDHGVTICTESNKIEIENSFKHFLNRPLPLLFFPIREFNYEPKIMLVYRKDTYQTMFFKKFVEIVSQYFEGLRNQTKNGISAQTEIPPHLTDSDQV